MRESDFWTKGDEDFKKKFIKGIREGDLRGENGRVSNKDHDHFPP